MHQLAAAGALSWRPPAAALEGVAVRVLVFAARARAVLGKLRSSVLARRHAPATPGSTRKSTGAARGAAPKAGEDESDDVQLKKNMCARFVSEGRSSLRPGRGMGRFHLSLRAAPRGRNRKTFGGGPLSSAAP